MREFGFSDVVGVRITRKANIWYKGFLKIIVQILLANLQVMSMLKP